MAAFVLRRATGGSALRGADTIRQDSASSNAVPASADLTLTLTTSAGGAIRAGASADLTLTLTTSASAGNWANATTESSDVPQAMTLRFALVATATVEAAVVPPPAGSTVAPIKRVSITMPAPTLDSEGRPT